MDKAKWMKVVKVLITPVMPILLLRDVYRWMTRKKGS